MTRAARAFALALVLAVMASPSRAASSAAESPGALRVGVAAIRAEASTRPASSLAGPAIDPEQVTRRLVAAFDARPGVDVVGPSGLPATSAHPSAREVREFARRAHVSNVIVGHTRPGEIGTDVALAVRSGHSGAVIAEYEVREVQSPGLEGAMNGAADALLRNLGDSPGTSDAERPAQRAEAVSEPKTAHVVSAEAEAMPPVSAAVTQRPEGKAADKEGGLIGELRRDEPISIESEELEFLNADARRHLVFSRNVRVVQGDIHLATERLEAFYPEGSGQPDRFVATGGVEVWQGERRAHCQRATYLREEEMVVCTGEALLLQNCDEVRGDRIEFDLGDERVRVIGAASILIQEDCEDGS